MKKQPFPDDQKKDKNKLRLISLKKQASLPYTNFEIEKFRCFTQLQINNIERVNLIAGRNNVGKTALLEALFLHLGADNLSIPARINSWRGIAEILKPTDDPGVFLATLFNGFDESKSIILKTTVSNGKQTKLTISKTHYSTSINQASKITSIDPTQITGHIKMEFQDASGKTYSSDQLPEITQKGDFLYPLPKFKNPCPGIFLYSNHQGSITEDVERFTRLRLKNIDDLLIKSLKIMEKRIKKLEILSPLGHSMLHVYLEGDDQPIMLSLLGDGIRRIASLILAISTAADGVVLADEIENGIHHSILGPLWGAIAEAADLFNTQIFATTHSMECIQAAHDAFKARDQYCFHLHRLDRSDNAIKAVTYDRETLEAALTIPLEIRGAL